MTYKADLLSARAIALEVADVLGQIAYLHDPDKADDAFAAEVLAGMRRAARFLDEPKERKRRVSAKAGE